MYQSRCGGFSGELYGFDVLGSAGAVNPDVNDGAFAEGCIAVVDVDVDGGGGAAGEGGAGGHVGGRGARCDCVEAVGLYLVVVDEDADECGGGGSGVLEPQGEFPVGVGGVPGACGGLDLDFLVLEVVFGGASGPVCDDDGENDGDGDEDDAGDDDAGGLPSLGCC